MAENGSTKRRNVKSSETTDQDAGRKIDFLTDDEMKRLIAGGKGSRYHERDSCIALVMYRHGLRVSELVGLRRDDLKLGTSQLYVRRLKGSLSTAQPIAGDELRAIKRYLATRDDSLPWLFISERKSQLTRHAVNFIIAAMSERAGLPHVNPHMLRHSCGFYLANRGVDFRTIQDYLGHKNPVHTAHYTRRCARAFDGLWE